jgi:hypothetical protein
MSERITVSTWLSEEQARQLTELVKKHNQDMQALGEKPLTTDEYLAAMLLTWLSDEYAREFLT